MGTDNLNVYKDIGTEPGSVLTPAARTGGRGFVFREGSLSSEA